MKARPLPALIMAFALCACQSEDTTQSPRAEQLSDNPHEQPPEAAAAKASNESPELSEFLSEGLHPIEQAAPGRFRLEVAGEVHEGDLTSCGWNLRTADGQNQDRFTASANWHASSGRVFQLELWRFIMHDDFFWNASHGHESERVQLRVRDDGGSLVNVQDTAVSELRVIRPQPGSSPRWRRGAGELPTVRVAPDGRQATATGELHGQQSESGTPLTGRFSLAVHCAES